MHTKAIVGIIAVLLVGLGVYLIVENKKEVSPTSEIQTKQTSGERSVPEAGSYTVVPEESEVSWSARKPLIEGYINSGTIGVSEGTITIGENTASGAFTIDMNSLKVGLTAKKPGREGALEGHLKKADFFDVATYPTATFTIDSVTPRADSETTFVYDVKGTLTMKGKTGEVAFPATIYEENGKLVAEAETMIDRTKWGITYGSGSFFDNLADNAVDDMVALSFFVTADKQ